jgi:hypothetical protein
MIGVLVCQITAVAGGMMYADGSAAIMSGQQNMAKGLIRADER